MALTLIRYGSDEGMGRRHVALSEPVKNRKQRKRNIPKASVPPPNADRGELQATLESGISMAVEGSDGRCRQWVMVVVPSWGCGDVGMW